MRGVASQNLSSADTADQLLRKAKRKMPQAGIEPAPYCYDGILSPARLPVPPLRHRKKFTKSGNNCQILCRLKTEKHVQGDLV